MNNTLQENLTRPESDRTEEIARKWSVSGLDLVTLTMAHRTPKSTEVKTPYGFPNLSIFANYDVSANADNSSKTIDSGKVATGLEGKDRKNEDANFDSVERQAKSEQAQRITPTVEAIRSVMTPELASQMKNAGLATDPQTLHDNMVKQMEDDQGLNAQQMKNMKSFPVGAGYVASGAITNDQLQNVLTEQKALRVKNSPETDLGHILRTHKDFDQTKISAADSMISALKV